MLRAFRAALFLFIGSLLVIGPLAVADDVLHLLAPAGGPNAPDCATVGTSNYDGPPDAEHSLVGGGLWVSVYVDTEGTPGVPPGTTPGSGIHVVTAPVNCLAGTVVSDILLNPPDPVSNVMTLAQDVPLPPGPHDCDPGPGDDP